MKKLRIYLPFVLLALTILIFAGCNSVIPSPGATEDVRTISGQIKLPVLCACDLSGEVPVVGDCDETEDWAIIANAVVELKSAQRGSCRRILDTTITDEDGNYQFEDVKPGLYIITAYCADPETHKTDNNLLVKDVAQKIEGIGLDAGIPDCTSTALALVIEKINNCYNDWYRCFGKLTNASIYNLVEKIAKDVNKVDIPAIMAHIDFGEYCDDQYEDLVDLICEWNCCTPSPGATGGGGGPTPSPRVGSLTITKVVDNDCNMLLRGGTQSECTPVEDGQFEFTVTGPNNYSKDFVLPDEGNYSKNLTGLAMGSYTITETDPGEGWSTTVQVGEAAPTSGRIGTAQLENNGQNIEVIFANTYEPPAVKITKTASPTTVTAAGQKVTYTYKVENTGGVKLTNVKVNDDKLGNINLGATTLAPGATTTGTKEHTVTQEELEAGTLVNVATVTNDQNVTDNDTATVTMDPAPAKYNLTTESSPIGGGTTSGDGNYEEGTVVPVSAQASNGYFFVNWTKDGAEISKQANFNYTMPPEDVLLTAHFAQEKGVQHILIEDRALLSYVKNHTGVAGKLEIKRTGQTYFRVVKLTAEGYTHTILGKDIGWCVTLNMPISSGIEYDVLLYPAETASIPADVFGGHYTPGKIEKVWAILEKAREHPAVSDYRYIQGAIWKATDNSYGTFNYTQAHNLYNNSGDAGTPAGVIAIPIKKSGNTGKGISRSGIPVIK